MADFDLGAITSTDLFAFVSARSGDLARVLNAASERHSLQLEQAKQQGVMSWVDWLFALRLASGDALHTPSNAEQSITDKLTMAARIDEDMQRVLAEWYAALERAGSQLRPQPKPRKRSHMVANA